MKKNKGFTLIELLVVIAIIAILSTVVMAGLNSARAKGRDAKRISDVKALQTALELYYDTNNGYPQSTSAAAETVYTVDSLEDALFSTYMSPLPKNPTPAGTTSEYTYCSATSAAPDTCAISALSYIITFGTETASAGLAAGAAHKAKPTGITQ